MTEPKAAQLTPNEARAFITLITDALFERLDEDVSANQLIKRHPERAERALSTFFEARFVSGELEPSPAEQVGVFWEAAASLLSRAPAAEEQRFLELLFRVSDGTVFHVVGPLLREVFFPSMLEPLLLEKIASDEPEVRKNARLLDYHLFQAKPRFRMSDTARTTFDELAALHDDP